ncbi:CLUMA_CG020019, isoform A, partial [Clunio marinus]
MEKKKFVKAKNIPKGEVLPFQPQQMKFRDRLKANSIILSMMTENSSLGLSGIQTEAVCISYDLNQPTIDHSNEYSQRNS